MAKRIFSALMCVTLILNTIFGFSLPSFAVVEGWDIGGQADWTIAYPMNNQNDYLQDQQTGSGTVSQDIVGDAVYPSTFVHFTDDTIAFRIRVNDIDGGTSAENYQFKNFVFIGVDADLNGSIDFFVGAYNPSGSNGRVGIYRASAGYANISPSTTGISGKPIMAYKPLRSTNFAITQAPDSAFNGDSDYFVSFKIPVIDLTTALTALGIPFNKSTPFRFMTGTAAQDNSFNQDLNGMDKNGWTSGNTWNSLGVFSGIVSADGTAVMHTVLFDKNTGDNEASPSVKAVSHGGVLGALPSSPTKRGMYFQEWNTSPDGTGTKVTSNTLINADQTFYAIWSDKLVYTVTFSLNGGTIGGSTDSLTIPTINGVIGDNMPDTPIRSGYYFMGWNTLAAPTGGNPGLWFNSASSVSGNITVYAQWKNQASNEALFYDNFTGTGGSLIARIYSNGQSNNFNGTLPSISRPGYTFDGWFNNLAGTGMPITDISAAGSYYAKWTVANYTVTFNANSGSDVVTNLPESRTIQNGMFGSLPVSPSRLNYEFIEWNRNANGSGEAMYPSTPISSSFQVFAIWRSSKLITFDSNGGQLEDSEGSVQQILAIDNMLTSLPQPPNRDAYTFLGWGTSADSSEVVDLMQLGVYDTLYAIWSPIYDVTFDSNQGTWSDAVTIQVIATSYGSVLYLPEPPSRTGYHFEGWRTLQDGGTTFNLSTDVVQNTTVYAHWTLIGVEEPTVSFQTNGGTPVMAITASQILSMPLSSKVGYSLEGWYRNSALSIEDKIEFPYEVSSDQILYAKWLPVMVSVTFDANNGIYGDAQTVQVISQTYDATYELPNEVPTRAGFTFATWNTAIDGSGSLITDETVVKAVSDYSVYAIWTELGNVTINYVPSNPLYGSVTLETESFNPESGMPVGSTASANAGYAFIEWQNSNGTQVSVEPTLIPQKVEDVYNSESFIAIFEPDVASPFNVVLDDNGGQGGSGSIYATYGAPMPVALSPQRSGYAFLGYFDAISGGNQYYNANMESLSNWDKLINDTTLYAQWKAHDLQGTIIDDGLPSSKLIGATVKVMRGTLQYGLSATTDGDGNFIIYNIPAGTYNLVITLGAKTQILAVVVNGSLPVTNIGTIIFPLGNASSTLNIIGADTPPVVIGNLHQEAERYFEDVDPSSFVKVEMVVQKTDKNTAIALGDTATINAITSIDSLADQSGAIIGLYLDLTIEKHQRNTELDPWVFKGNIERTNNMIQIIIPIPDALRNRQNYVMYRYHGNEVNAITSTPNSDGEYLTLNQTDWSITMYVKNFSVYALGYLLASTPPTPNDEVAQSETIPSVETAEAAVPTIDSMGRFAYISGYPNKSFGAEKSMTRAEAVAMFARLMSQNDEKYPIYSTKFKDVKGTEWFANKLGYMVQFNFIGGYSDGTFRPNAPITRAEFAVLATRFDEMVIGKVGTFSDVPATHWASEQILSAATKGWISGYPDGTFRPENQIKRSEVVALVNRMLNRQLDQTLLITHPEIRNMYADLDDSHWAFYDILEASIEKE